MIFPPGEWVVTRSDEEGWVGYQVMFGSEHGRGRCD